MLQAGGLGFGFQPLVQAASRANQPTSLAARRVIRVATPALKNFGPRPLLPQLDTTSTGLIRAQKYRTRGWSSRPTSRHRWAARHCGQWSRGRSEL